ncbi:hypothetical protein PT285_04445 [Lactobacillus sp. ESL0791]|uniref:hypothetical protein n=1 Tax=Lactobacillus sp. ESL0791 TaxID=2983234 RepID=UPI0023F826FC|nr:hypothetical protein [Lactobacillus sp. ESL0791]MDF7638648.1 hypothetical protein [Lactobacillus sp. ESL0791]
MEENKSAHYGWWFIGIICLFVLLRFGKVSFIGNSLRDVILQIFLMTLPLIYCIESNKKQEKINQKLVEDLDNQIKQQKETAKRMQNVFEGIVRYVSPRDKELVFKYYFDLEENVAVTRTVSTTLELTELLYNLANLLKKFKTVKQKDIIEFSDWENFARAREILREFTTWVFIAVNSFNMAAENNNVKGYSSFYNIKEKTLLQVLAKALVDARKINSYGPVNFENFFKGIERHHPEICRLLDCNSKSDLADLLKIADDLTEEEAENEVSVNVNYFRKYVETTYSNVYKQAPTKVATNYE